MRILGIDYGRSKIGLSLSFGSMAEPLRVIRVISVSQAVSAILDVVRQEKIEEIVVGVSEGKMGEESVHFADSLRSLAVGIPCKTFDETLTSFDAQRLSMAAGINRKKRRQMEDAYAAAIMLQSYIDEKLR